MTIILFIIYLLLFCFIITRIRFLDMLSVPTWVLPIIFCIKVAAGVAYGFYFNLPSQRDGADTYRFFRESLPETQLLLHHPFLFIQSLFTHGYDQTGNLFIGSNSYWNDLKDNIIIKILAVCNAFSGSNYFVNIIFFNFFYLFGLVAFFRLLKPFNRVHPYILVATVFLMPSFLFWCSGIHKDGLIVSGIGLVFFCCKQLMVAPKASRYWLVMSISWLFLFFVKNFLALALLPALFGWYVSEKNKHWQQFYFIAIYSGGILLLMLFGLMGEKFNALHYIVNKQHEFLLLEGASAMKLPLLQPTIESMIHYLPKALDIAFFRPHFSDAKSAAYLLPFAEIMVYTAIVLTYLWLMRSRLRMPPFYICCMYFAISILLLDGFTVTFIGAIVRYRSLMLPFIMAPIISMLPFNTIHFSKKK